MPKNTKWNRTGNLMLGQMYDEKKDRFFGSIFRNEMEFHVFTRTQNGFCDKCDLDPPERTDEEGYKLPGRLFHSKAGEFRDSYFNDWTTDKLFVQSTPKNWKNFDIFSYKDKGRAVETCLTQHSQLQLLTGKYCESESAREFMTCEEADIGLIFSYNTQHLKQLIEQFPEDFKLYLGDVQSDFTVNRILDEIYYGGQVMLRFQGEEDEDVGQLYANVELFGKCLVGDCEPTVLDKLSSCRVWIGPSSVDSNTKTIGPYSTDFRSALNDVQKFLDGVYSKSHGKGISLWWYCFQSIQYKRFQIDYGENNCRPKLWDKPEVRVLSTYNISSGKPAKLYVEVSALSRDLLAYSNENTISLNEDFQNGLERFRGRLIQILQGDDVEKKITAAKKLIKEYEISDCSPSRIRTRLEAQLEKEEDKCLLCISEMRSKGLELLPSSEKLKNEPYYVLFEFPQFAQSRLSWKDNYELFMSLVTQSQVEGRPRKFYINELEEGGFAIKAYRNGQLVSADMLGDYRKSASKKNPSYRVTFLARPQPFDLVAVKGLLGLPCPFSWKKGCPTTYQIWKCDECQAYLRSNLEKSAAVCRCGIVSLTDCAFRCTHPQHGLAPVYPKHTLPEINPRSEVNVLLVGETGSGKSNLINSIANYLAFQNLSEASASKPLYVIPTAYSVPYENKPELRTVFVGQDINEKQSEDHTHTLSCRNYIFPIGNDSVVRIMDTPGFPVDLNEQESFLASVLNHAGQSSSPLHAVCFVVKTTEGLLSETFKSMIRKVCDTFLPNRFNSTVFLFTDYDRKTSSVKVLKQLESLAKEFNDDPEDVPVLNSENSFKLNNEVFPYLLSSYSGESFQDFEVAKYQKSFEMSSKECRRFFEHLAKLEPFDPREMLWLEEKVALDVTEVLFSP